MHLVDLANGQLERNRPARLFLVQSGEACDVMVAHLVASQVQLLGAVVERAGEPKAPCLGARHSASTVDLVMPQVQLLRAVVEERGTRVSHLVSGIQTLCSPQRDVTSQVQLLGAVVEEPGNLKCRVWARELMELLYPLAARSRIVAALLLQARCRVASFGGVRVQLLSMECSPRSAEHRHYLLHCDGRRRPPSLCSEPSRAEPGSCLCAGAHA